jgi:hypothetical protein
MMLIVLPDEASNASGIRHPDKASNTSGRNWLLASGQLRASEAGTVLKSRSAPSPMPSRKPPNFHRMRQRKPNKKNQRRSRPAVRDPPGTLARPGDDLSRLTLDALCMLRIRHGYRSSCASLPRHSHGTARPSRDRVPCKIIFDGTKLSFVVGLPQNHK